MSAATAANRSGSLLVRVDDAGTLLGVHMDRDELRYGGPSLAAAILELYAAAHAEAIHRRRAELLEYGMAPDVVDRIHPAPSRPTDRPAPPQGRSWMRDL